MLTWDSYRLNKSDFKAPCTTTLTKVLIAQRIGGAEEDRTPDLSIANATLSQLSYRPTTDA